jgi:8-oxo-dGTP pyrophosphatase MutT (NUDIX family)
LIVVRIQLETLYKNIKIALSGRLRGEESHRKMMPPYRQHGFSTRKRQVLRPSSVLLLLFPDGGVLYTILIKRPMTMKHHAGQIAFPGGRIDAGESALEAAFRETEEEIGIEPDRIELLGSLSELVVDASGYLIHPFVGWLPDVPRFCLNRDEVERVILFPVLNAMERRGEVEMETFYGQLTVPCYRIDGDVVWGATSMILTEFLDLLDGHGLE